MPEEPLSVKLKKALTYANGYRELGMLDDALRELDSLEAELVLRPPALQMRLAILMEAGRWREALQPANLLAATSSSDSGHLVNLAFVTRRADSLQAAQTILESAARIFPEDAIIHYNLGCYACCLGDLETAKRRLKRAFAIDASFLASGRDDEDLATLRDWLDGLAD